MKTIATTLALLTGILLIPNSALAGKKSDFNQEVSILEVSGVMTVNDQKVSGYMVYLFKDGIMTDSFYIDNRREQYFGLELNHDYALKFTKEGYKDRTLLVDTHLPENAQANSYYTFRYSIEFIGKDESNTFDDFPVAFVTYDAKKKDFDYNRTYHFNVRYNAGKNANETVSQSPGRETDTN